MSGPDSAPGLRRAPEAAITVSDLCFRYTPDEDGEDLLRGLTASVSAGSVTALLGPNGVGKTTLLNLILGWLRPRQGTVALFGRELGSLSRRETGRTLSLLPQEEHVPFEYSALEYVLLGRTPYLPRRGSAGPRRHGGYRRGPDHGDQRR